MKFHFVLDGILQGTLLPIESLCPLVAIVLLSSISRTSAYGPVKGIRATLSKLGAFLLNSLEDVLKATGLDLIRFTTSSTALTMAPSCCPTCSPL